jgi:hypothetical protein
MTDRSNFNLFNPILAWFDWGLRAAEISVASSQNINDAVDRITRAGASVESDETGATRFVAWDAPVARVPATLGRVGDFHRRVFDLTTETWVRWMSALGTRWRRCAPACAHRVGARSRPRSEMWEASLIHRSAGETAPWTCNMRWPMKAKLAARLRRSTNVRRAAGARALEAAESGRCVQPCAPDSTCCCAASVHCATSLGVMVLTGVRRPST